MAQSAFDDDLAALHIWKHQFSSASLAASAHCGIKMRLNLPRKESSQGSSPCQNSYSLLLWYRSRKCRRVLTSRRKSEPLAKPKMYAFITSIELAKFRSRTFNGLFSVADDSIMGRKRLKRISCERSRMSGEDCMNDLEYIFVIIRFLIECGLLSMVENMDGTLRILSRLHFWTAATITHGSW